ncbi:unnamed protein product [Chrysoparadoxa australica]
MEGTRRLYVWGQNDDGQLGLPPKPLAPLPSPYGHGQVGLPLSPKAEEDPSYYSFGGVEQSIPTPTICYALTHTGVTQVSCGSRHTLALVSGGIVYSWGWGARGQLGHGTTKTCCEPRVIQALADVGKAQAISAGGIHSAVIISSEGSKPEAPTVWTFGANDFGQLGVKEEEEAALLPSKVPKQLPRAIRAIRAISPNSLTATKVSCGGMHTAAVSPGGELFTWGRCDSGQLGIGYDWVHQHHNANVRKSSMGIPYPQKVQGEMRKKASISLSDLTNHITFRAFHTAALCCDGTVYTFGKEDYGVLSCSTKGLISGGLTLPHLVCLGDDEVVAPSFLPPLLQQGNEFGVKGKAVACGGWHRFLVLSSGGIPYACGRGEYGRLGLGDECSRRVLEPIEINQTRGIVWHHDPPSCNAVQLLRLICLYACTYTSTDVATGVIKSIACGGSHSLMLTESGVVYSFGRAHDGRLGLVMDRSDSPERNREIGEVVAPKAVQTLSIQGWSVESIACGGKHSAAVLVKDDIGA